MHDQTAQILRSWLNDIGFDIEQPLRPYPDELRIQVHKWITSQNIDEKQTAHLLKLLPSCASAADKWFPFASQPLKRYITLFTIFLLYVDDVAENNLSQILPDLQKITAGAKSGLQAIDINDSCIALWVTLVHTETDQFFGPYATGCITKGFIDYFMGTMVESTFGISCAPLPGTQAFRAAGFLRDKTGAGEIYVHFLFPEDLLSEKSHLRDYFPYVRAIIDIFDYVNDILSFFKESIVGTEENTYIVNRARACGCLPLDILQELCGEVMDVWNIVGDAFRDRGKIGDVWAEFVNGYVMWHVSDPRYRLTEIGMMMRS